MDNQPQNDSYSIPIVTTVIVLAIIAMIFVFWGLVQLSNSKETNSLQVTMIPTADRVILAETPTILTVTLEVEYGSVPTNIPDGVEVAPIIITLPPTIEGFQTRPPLQVEQGELIFNGDRTEMVIALTFDVGETAENPAGFDWGIIEVLTQTETPATFFLGGLWMTHNPAETQFLAESPQFEIGNHAWSHLDFSQITPEQMSNEILMTQKEMWNQLGWQTEIFRLPYGTYTNEALNIIADHGMLTIQWDVVSGDPDPNILAEPMANWVISQVQPGSIIIMHANGRGWNTAEALPTIITNLEAQGYRFVTISELLKLENKQTP